MATTEARAQRSDARRNRETILVAARKLFAEEGLDAQVPDLARAANVGVGTIYRHFPRKDDLIAALVADRFERLADKARECLELEDPWEGITSFIWFATQIQADDRGLCDVMGSRPDLMGAAAEGAGLPELSDQLVKRAQRAGKLRQDLVWEDIGMIACSLGSSTRHGSGPGGGHWPRLVEIVIDGLRPR
jgi:AcrR family transcriptional regulator